MRQATPSVLDADVRRGCWGVCPWELALNTGYVSKGEALLVVVVYGSKAAAAFLLCHPCSGLPGCDWRMVSHT
jgi:hypothetical protein